MGGGLSLAFSGNGVAAGLSSRWSYCLGTRLCSPPCAQCGGVLEALFPVRTVWGLPIRKSWIKLQRDVFMPLLNAELKSMNSILMSSVLFIQIGEC